MSAQVRFIDLFAGIGGFRYGLENANINTFGRSQGNEERASEEVRSGLHPVRQEDSEASGGQDSGDADDQPSKREFTCVYTNEWDKYAAQIYEKNFTKGGQPRQMGQGFDCSNIKRDESDEQCASSDRVDRRDLRTVPSSEIPDHDLLVGGFPCQAFSIAGKRAGFDDTRGTLFFEIARILADKRPRYFLLENVKGLLSHDGGKTIQTIFGVLTDLGYEYQWQVLNSKNFGVPQNRERIYIIGHLRGTSRPEVFPIRGENSATLKYVTGGGLDPWLDNGKNLSRNHSQGQRVYSPVGVSSTLSSQGGGWGAKTGLYMVDDPSRKKGLVQKDESPTIRSEAHGNLPVVGVTIQEGQLKERHNSTTVDANYWKGLDNHQARTGVKDGLKIRRLTPTECERLQGFPDGWTEGVSDSQRYKCLGNAVTTNVITAIGRKLLTSMP